MADMFDDIKKFHEKFKLEYNGEPRYLSIDLAKFRYTFMSEELEEYRIARRNSDLSGQLDALVDLVYVALGTAYMHGFDFDEAWRRVHEANMKKIKAPSKDASKRGSEYDVVKPVGWVPPYLKDLA